MLELNECLKKENSELRLLLSDVDQTYDTKLTRLYMKLKDLQKTVEKEEQELQEDLIVKDKEIEETKLELNELERIFIEVEISKAKEVNVLNEMFTTSKQKEARMKEELKSAHAQIAALESLHVQEKQGLQKKLDCLEHDLVKCRELIAAKEAEMKLLKKHFDEMKCFNEHLKDRISLINKENLQRKNLITKNQNKIEELNKQLDGALEQIEIGKTTAAGWEELAFRYQHKFSRIQERDNEIQELIDELIQILEVKNHSKKWFRWKRNKKIKKTSQLETLIYQIEQIFENTDFSLSPDI